MSGGGCAFEERVVRAARTGKWDPDTRAHLAACGDCREAALVGGFMARVAAATRPGDPLPDPAAIWARSLEARRREAALRATRPIAVMEGASWAAALAVVLGGLAWAWPAVKQAFWAWIAGGGPAASQAPAIGAAYLLPLGLGLLLTSSVVALYEAWASD